MAGLNGSIRKRLCVRGRGALGGEAECFRRLPGRGTWREW